MFFGKNEIFLKWVEESRDHPRDSPGARYGVMGGETHFGVLFRFQL